MKGLLQRSYQRWRVAPALHSHVVPDDLKAALLQGSDLERIIVVAAF
jgi:hypothetical protein